MTYHCKAFGLAAAAAMMGLSAGAASATVIDFDALDASEFQTVPLTSFSEDGYTFSLTFTPGGLGPAIFDTNCSGAACNGDEDLVPSSQDENGIAGNVLILQEDANGALVPNDEADGGTIIFTLDAGDPFYLTGFSAIDDEDFSVIASDGTTTLGSISLANENETDSTTFKSSLINVGDTFTFDYEGSGGIDSVTLQAVPLPAAGWLMLAGFGGLAALRRRKRAA